MEGRQPPPKASHPFPDYPDMTKFWGTPYSKATFKLLGMFCAIYGTFIGFNMYITRHQKGPFGQDFTMTKEQASKLQELRQITGYLQFHYQLPVDYNAEKAKSVGGSRTMLFDDGIKFNPPREMTKTSLEYEVPEHGRN